MNPAENPDATVDGSSSIFPPEEESTHYGHFRVLTRPDGTLWELGRGAMGVTYKALDKNLQAPVTLKLIRCEQIGRQQARERFLREARAAAALRHPHVATVFHLGEEDGTIFYAMEFVEGETLDARIRREGKIAAILALQIARQVASALAAAQKIGLIHRDIKPSNIMLAATDDESIQVKVIDFGLAKQVEGTDADDEAPTLTVAGFVGTPHFASPEQLEEQELDGRSDVYSLGVTLYYMLAGTAPFGGSIAQVISQHLQRQPPLDRLADQHPDVIALVEELLRKDREDRPTAAALVGRIDKCLQSLQPTSPPASIASSSAKSTPLPASGPSLPPPLPTPPAGSSQVASSPSGYRLLRYVLPGAILLLVLLAFLGFWLTKGSQEAQEKTLSPSTLEITPAKSSPEVSSPTPESENPAAPSGEAQASSSSFAEALHEAREQERHDSPLPSLLAYAELAHAYPDEVAPRLGLEKALEKLEVQLAAEGISPQETAQVRPALESAATDGYASAQFLLGEILQPIQPDASLAYLQAAAEQNHAEAAARLGWLYSSGRVGAAPDFTQAVRWFDVAARLNHPYAMTLLADCYLRGLGVPEADPQRAVQLLESASALGEDRAMDLLGYLHRRGLGLAQPNPQRAFALFQKAAELGNLDAQGNLGIMYMLGESVPADAQKAVALWREGAEKGNATCMLFLAKSLLDPHLGDDPDAATTWFVRAAQGGNTEAQAWCQEQEVDWTPTKKSPAPSTLEKSKTEPSDSSPAQNPLPPERPIH